MRTVPLEAIHVGEVFGGSEETVFLLAGKSPFYPALCLILQGLIVKDVSQRYQAVNPVRTALPFVAVSSKPAVTVSHNIGDYLVQVAGHAGSLAQKLIPEPAVGFYGAQREFHIRFMDKW